MYATAPSWVLVASSHFFFIPISAYYLTGEYVCSALVTGTYVVSVAYHSTKPAYPFLLPLDVAFAQIGNLCAVYTTSQYLPYSLLPYSVFLGSALTIYYYGKHTQPLAWDPDLRISNWWHTFMHMMLGGTAGVSIFLSAAARKKAHQLSSSS
jgi:hypothetical protein